jgi:hypothetical protein
VPGARQSHYRVRPDAFEGIMRQRIVGVSQARALADRGLGVLESASPERKQRLTAKRDFYAFLEREMEELLRHWHALTAVAVTAGSLKPASLGDPLPASLCAAPNGAGRSRGTAERSWF